MARRQSRLIRERIEVFSGGQAAKFAQNIIFELIERTPVLTGFAQTSWVPQIGSPFLDQIGVKPDGFSDAQQNDGISSLASYRPRMGSIFINNNAPYIGLLNLGSSTQAPSGFVERAIAAARASL